ncbi:hypothetical protein CEXT_158921 [Caerostris extrusa]|uniref:LAGLIDADG homing endonuclease n=1 Tax=Caerostris extrusa TaxID=172846 RepID=A0AAV4XKZ8_CAEEX|nr:hypothetical protein CEXT_158921 [Caerostris extrusa]
MISKHPLRGTDRPLSYGYCPTCDEINIGRSRKSTWRPAGSHHRYAFSSAFYRKQKPQNRKFLCTPQLRANDLIERLLQGVDKGWCVLNTQLVRISINRGTKNR